MQVKSVAECSKGSILQYFWASLSYHLLLRPLFCVFLSGCLRQVLLYINFIIKWNVFVSNFIFRHPVYEIIYYASCVSVWNESINILKYITICNYRQLLTLCKNYCIQHLLSSISVYSKYSKKINMSLDMRFTTMWYVQPAKPQISLRICAVWSEPLLVA